MVVFKMAIAFSPGGHHSPTALTRTIEKVFDEAEHTGHINLVGRKLKDYPKLASKYDLSDTSHADLSKNRYSEIPPEVCEYTSMEELICYHNVIRCIPQAIVQLQALVRLNLSRNQLSNIPPFICQLQSLEVLKASNNKLVSLPEEIGRLDRLMELDVSCNEITHLPMQIGDLESLKTLDVRRNLLVELPDEISKLSLQKLDCSCNKISTIPTSFRKIEMLAELILDHNPLVSPPAHICTKGRVHIMKYLIMEAIKEDRKRGILISENDHHMRRHFRKSSSLQLSNSDELKQMTLADSPVDRRKRNGYMGGDSGYNTTDSTEKSQWSPPEHGVIVPHTLHSAALRLSVMSCVNNEVEELNNLAIKAAENVKEQRHEREMELQRRIAHDAVSNGPIPLSNQETDLSHELAPDSLVVQDEFTRELNRQKAEYEAKKRRAEQLRIEKEEEEERERRRLAAIKLQEEQKAVMERQREDMNLKTENNYSNTSTTNTTSTAQPDNDYTYSPEPEPLPVRKPVVQTSQSFKEDRKTYQNNNLYRRTVSENSHHYTHTRDASRDANQPYYRNNGVNVSAESSPSVSRRTQPAGQYLSNQESEFRLRHEALVQQQRQEAQNVMRRIEEEKKRMKQMQKDAVQTYNNKNVPRNNYQICEPDDRYHYNGENGSSQPYTNHPSPKPKTTHTFSIGAQKRLEELASHNPNFTIRRQLENAREELEKIEQLRRNIENRLKVTLPDDLPAALRDGVVLCHLANHIRPRSVSSIHVPSPAVPKLSMAKCRRNVENFLEACRRIGVDSDKLCSASDILEEKGLVRTAVMVQTLLNKALQPRQSAV